ncbi:MAG: hypothetical protein ACFFFC_18185 [Candidatus Thorarchaeota archaeon]
MRKLSIILPKTAYTPREAIAGVLEVTCDKKFDSKETSISFVGTIKAEGYELKRRPGGGFIQETTKLEKNLVEGTIVLSEEKRYEEGSHTFNFSFQLPASKSNFTENLNITSGLLPSREGISEAIKYLIHANIKVSRFKSERAQIPITIYIPLEEWPKVVKSEKSILDKDENILDLETDTDLYCIGHPYELRYRINTTEKIRKLKFGFFHVEYARLGGGGRKEIRLYDMEITHNGGLHEWQTVTLQPDREFPQSFNTDVLESTLLLAVRVEYSKRKAAETELHLLAQYCPEKSNPHLSENHL